MNLRRFELRLEECIIARFATNASAPMVVRGAPEGPQHRPSHSAALLYVAARAREVDEPAGLWIVPDGSGASPVHGLQPKTGLASDVPILGVLPAPDGRVAVLSTVAGTFMLRETGHQPSRSSSNGRTNPNSNFKQSHICFSRKPCRFRDPVALAFVWKMPDARSVRASATRGGRESAQCLVPVHHSTRQ